MKKTKILLVGAALLAASAVQANAFTLANTADGTFNNVASITFDPGSALSVGANPFANGGATGPFELLYQANGSGLIDALGVKINKMVGYEITAVARAWETATGLGTTGATFQLAPGTSTKPNIVDFYYTTTVGGNVASGADFNTGTLIMSAAITKLSGVFNQQDTNLNGILDNQDAGQGSTQISGTVTSVNSLYLPDTNIGQTMVFFEAFTNTPPTGVATTKMWDGTVPNYYTGAPSSSPFTTPDILLAAGGRASEPVPEPGTLLLLGAGLTGLAIVRKRKGNA